MSNEVIHDKARRTESTNRLSAAIRSLVDCATEVSDALHDVSSRASLLDAKSDDILGVIDDSSRLAAVIDALCARHPRYARFLWTAARNLVRDVIGHVTSTDLHTKVKVAEDETECRDIARRQSRRAAAELDLFYGEDSLHLACT